MNHFNTILRTPETTRRPSQTERPGKLAVSVVFTSLKGTAAALQSARAMARDLGAAIRLEVPVQVPLRLPLDQPLVPTEFTEKVLRSMVDRLEMAEFAPSIHIYLCRDRLEALDRILLPESLVVIGGQKRWWPTPESRLAKSLARRGNRVALVDAADAGRRRDHQ